MNLKLIETYFCGCKIPFCSIQENLMRLSVVRKFWCGIESRFKNTEKQLLLYEQFQHINGGNGLFCIVLTHQPPIHVVSNKGIFACRLNFSSSNMSIYFHCWYLNIEVIFFFPKVSFLPQFQPAVQVLFWSGMLDKSGFRCLVGWRVGHQK